MSGYYRSGRQYPRLYRARVATRRALWRWIVLWLAVSAVVAVIGLFR